MFNRTRNKPSIDTLVIENSFYCDRICGNCYQKERKITNILGYKLYMNLIEELLKQKIVKSFVLSFNTSEYGGTRAIAMQRLIKNIAELENENINLACHDWRDATDILRLTNKWPGNLYLSVAQGAKNHRDLVKGKIIHNLTTDNLIIKKLLYCSPTEKAIEKVTQIWTSLDEVHLVFVKHKESNQYKDYKNWYQFVDQIKEQFPEVNFTTDRCMQMKHCGANLSSMCLWPDGSISGCPYTKTADTGPAYTVEGIVDNMKEALTKKVYGTDKCIIYTERQRNKPIAIAELL